MTERDRSRVQAAEMRYLLAVVGRTILDRIPSSVTREELGVEPLLLHVERGQMKWLGHVLRMGQYCLVRRICEATPVGNRPRGRPRLRWRDSLLKVCERADLGGWADVCRPVEDRDRWRALARGLTPRLP